MIELVLAAALELQRPIVRDVSDCRPRQHLLRSAPPPPVFSIERFEATSEERTGLSAYRCPDGVNWRVIRYANQGARHDYVLGSGCADAVRWIEAAARLPLPRPKLAAFGETPQAATWFVLNADHITGGGYARDMRLTLVEQSGQAADPIAIWAREGEAIFERCGPVRVEWAR